MSEVRFRNDYEHALDRSGLPALTRLVLRVLVSRADWQTGMFRKERYMPSVAALAAAAGLTDRAVQKHLRAAEDAGWLVIEQRSGKKSGFTLVVPGVPDEANPDSYETPADIVAPPVDNWPVDNPTPERGSGVPPNVVHPDLTCLTGGSDRRSPYVRTAADPEVEERNKILGEFAQGRLYGARSDVPDCRPSAVRSSDLCRRCGGYTCGEQCWHLEEPLALASLLDWRAT